MPSYQHLMEIGTITEMTMCCRTDATAATMAVPAGASMEPFERRADAPDVVLGREGENMLRCYWEGKKKEVEVSLNATLSHVL